MARISGAVDAKSEKHGSRVDRDDVFDGVTDGTKSIEADADEKLYEPPDGGLHAWLVAFGGFGNMFCTFGFLNSFG